jgi:hypothetical protein
MPIQAQESWFRFVTRSAAQVRKRFGVPDKATEGRIVRVFRAALRPRKKAGRKPDQKTASAATMWADGMDSYPALHPRPPLRLFQRLLWQRIYRQVFPDFARLEKLERQYRTNTLRRNVKAYLRRRDRIWSRRFRHSSMGSPRQNQAI